MNINFTLIAQAIAFAILIWFTVKYVWPPLLNAIEKRQKEIADGLAAAQEGKASLEVAAKKTTQQLNEAKQNQPSQDLMQLQHLILLKKKNLLQSGLRCWNF